MKKFILKSWMCGFLLICMLGMVVNKVSASNGSLPNIYLYQKINHNNFWGCLDLQTPIFIRVVYEEEGSKTSFGSPRCWYAPDQRIAQSVLKPSIHLQNKRVGKLSVDSACISNEFQIPAEHIQNPGYYTLRVNSWTHGKGRDSYAFFEVVDQCENDQRKDRPVPINSSEYYEWALCDQINEKQAREMCIDCYDIGGIWTAVGCIPTDPMQMIKVLLRIGLLIGGGVALLIILAGSFILSTSSGDPKKTSEAKEMISSALIGLVFIIFSVSILQLIGVQILRIPGFGQ